MASYEGSGAPALGPDHLATADYGFEWGPIQVSRTYALRANGTTYYAVTIEPSEAEKAGRRTWYSIMVTFTAGRLHPTVQWRRVRRGRYGRRHPFAGEERHRVIDGGMMHR